jgi:hypothetical protein
VYRAPDLGMRLVMVVVVDQVYSLVKDVCSARRAADDCSLESLVEEGRSVLE